MRKTGELCSEECGTVDCSIGVLKLSNKYRRRRGNLSHQCDCANWSHRRRVISEYKGPSD
ncbi:hypothetical protein Mapa_013094 [Marchantia paleacea]|nr:hypothetical protein Mapa_013094 [Marchantia paleacea]